MYASFEEKKKRRTGSRENLPFPGLRFAACPVPVTAVSADQEKRAPRNVHESRRKKAPRKLMGYSCT